jgi:hypothetical protein
MGTIAIVKCNRTPKVHFDNYIDISGLSVWKPQPNFEKNAEYCIKQTIKQIKPYSSGMIICEGLWPKHQRDVFRNKWRVGYLDLNKTYVEIGYVESNDEHEIKLYENEYDLNKGINELTDTMNLNDPTVSDLRKMQATFIKRCNGKYQIHKNDYSSIEASKLISDIFEERFQKVVTLESRVFWIYDDFNVQKDMTLMKDLGKILVFPPQYSPESVASLFEAVKEELETKARRISANNQSGTGTANEYAAEWSKEVELYKPIFSGVKEFEDLLEEVKVNAHQVQYRDAVLEEADVFGDIEL